MAIEDHEGHIPQVIIMCNQVRQGPNGCMEACLDAPQGQVVVRICQGSIHCLLIDGGEELVPLREALVVIHEKGLAMLSGVLDADPKGKPGPVEPLAHA